MNESVIWQGQPLPQARPGQVWGMLIYPGGRKELRQYPPDMLNYVDEAVKLLRANREARVWLDDVSMVDYLLSIEPLKIL